MIYQRYLNIFIPTSDKGKMMCSAQWHVQKSPATYTCSRVLSTNIKNFFVQYPYHAVIGGNLKAIPNSPFLNCKWPNSNPLYGLDEVTLCVRYVLKSLYSIIEQPISNVLPC